jgi:NADH-quinone oxidoreductase subunit C
MSDHPPPRPQAPAEMAATAWADEFTSRVNEAFGAPGLQFASYLGQQFIISPAESVAALIKHLHQAESFDMLVDLTAVDYPKREARFELIYILYSFASNKRVRVKVNLREGQPAPSITNIFVGANWLEREVFDMFGITFDGHPNLKRILLPDEWNGYPLRKDASITGMDNAWVQSHLGIESGQ